MEEKPFNRRPHSKADRLFTVAVQEVENLCNEALELYAQMEKGRQGMPHLKVNILRMLAKVRRDGLGDTRQVRCLTEWIELIKNATH